MEERKSKQGFNSAMIALMLFGLVLILHFFEISGGSEFFSIMLAILLIVAILVGVFGLKNSIQGLREPISMEQIVGITVNGVFTIILIWLIGEVATQLA